MLQSEPQHLQQKECLSTEKLLILPWHLGQLQRAESPDEGVDGEVMDDCWESPSSAADSIESSLDSMQNLGSSREKAITTKKHSLSNNPKLAL